MPDDQTATNDRDAGDGANGSTYLRRSIELLWDTRQPPARGPKPGLTLARIVTAAIKIADADGVEGLSMRRVASELGVGTMSLYRYVPGKAELLDLMLDQVSAPDGAVMHARHQGLRPALETLAHQGRQTYLTHPWLLRVNWCRPVFGPNTLAGFEETVAALDGLGLTSQERIAVITAIDSYVTGAVRQQVQYTAAPDETGISEEEFWTQQYPVLEQAMATGDYPAIAALDEDAFSASWEDSFEFGLARLLDGIDALVASRSQPSGQPSGQPPDPPPGAAVSR